MQSASIFVASKGSFLGAADDLKLTNGCQKPEELVLENANTRPWLLRLLRVQVVKSFNKQVITAEEQMKSGCPRLYNSCLLFLLVQFPVGSSPLLNHIHTLHIL